MLELAACIQILILDMTYWSLYRKRQVILQTLECLPGIFRNLSTDINFRKSSWYILLSFFYFQSLVCLWSVLLSYTNDDLEFENKTGNSTENFFYQQFSSYSLYIDILEHLFTILIAGVMSLFAVYYSLICNFTKTAFDVINTDIQGLTLGNEFKYLICAYESTILVMSSIEEAFSFTAFGTVTNNMIGLFTVGYSLAFNSDSSYTFFFYSITGGLYFLTQQLMLMVPASNAVQSANDARLAMLSLPGVALDRYQEVKCLVEKKSKPKKTLTLWKIFVINRPLVVGSFGTLLTYGILIGTLGKVQSHVEMQHF